MPGRMLIECAGSIEQATSTRRKERSPSQVEDERVRRAIAYRRRPSPHLEVASDSVYDEPEPCPERISSVDLSASAFTPTGKGFKIKMPAKPRRIDDLYGDIDPNGYKSVDVYGSSQSSPIRREY